MSMELVDSAFDEAHDANVRRRVLDAIRYAKITRQQFADEIGRPSGTVGPWLNNKYGGDLKPLVEAAEKWLRSRAEMAAVAKERVAPPPFQMTPTAETVMRTLDHAQMNGKMVLIPLRPGTGKTEACKQHARQRNRVFHATLRPTTSGTTGLLEAILIAMGEPHPRELPSNMSRRIAAKVREPGALIILDEAQHAKVEAIDELRSIHDETGCGLAIVGDENLRAIFDHAKFAQLRRRIGRRCPSVASLDPDVVVLAEAWKVSDAEEIAFLKAVAKKPGALGGVTNVMEMATSLAKMEDEPRNLGHMRAAWSELMPEVAV